MQPFLYLKKHGACCTAPSGYLRDYFVGNKIAQPKADLEEAKGRMPGVTWP